MQDTTTHPTAVMKTLIQKTDSELKTDVLFELKYEPSVKVTDIGVLVQDGTVTLNGLATSYGERWDAVRAARRVAGVRAIADDIVVQISGPAFRTDGDLATAAAKQIEWSTNVPPGSVEVTVRDGWITLTGEVEWWYQKDNAAIVIRYLSGVKGVNNCIAIQPRLAAGEIESAIGAAFARNALLEARKIQIVTSGNAVTLRGEVRNAAERDEAERVAWAAPGVRDVSNEILVEWT